MGSEQGSGGNAVRGMLFREKRGPDGRITLEPLTSRRFLTISEVASVLRVSVHSVYRRIDEGQLRVFRFGGARRVKVEDLSAYIEQAGSDGDEALRPGRAMDAAYQRMP